MWHKSYSYTILIFLSTTYFFMQVSTGLVHDMAVASHPAKGLRNVQGLLSFRTCIWKEGHSIFCYLYSNQTQNSTKKVLWGMNKEQLLTVATVTYEWTASWSAAKFSCGVLVLLRVWILCITGKWKQKYMTHFRLFSDALIIMGISDLIVSVLEICVLCCV